MAGADAPRSCRVGTVELIRTLMPPLKLRGVAWGRRRPGLDNLQCRRQGGRGTGLPTRRADRNPLLRREPDDAALVRPCRLARPRRARLGTRDRADAAGF